MRLRSASISARLLLGLVLAVTAIAAGWAVTGALDHADARAAMAQDLQVLGDVLAANSLDAVVRSSAIEARAVLSTAGAHPSVIAAGIVDGRGQVLARYDREPGSIAPALAFEVAPPIFKEHGVVVVRPIEAAGRRIGAVCVVGDYAVLEARFARFAWIATAALGLAASAVFVWFLHVRRAVVDPVLALCRVADRVAAERDFGLRAEVTGSNEIGALALRFNGMLQQAERSNEELISAWRRAEAATKAKSSFLANMSHEIRTPMTAILGYAEVLRDESSSPKERAHAAETIDRNGQHLLELINNILDLSKIEAGMMTIETSACAPISVVAEVVELFRVRAQSKSLELRASCDGPVPAWIRSDSIRLKQILVNLIGNAIKFTEKGSVHITLRARSERMRQVLEIDVADTGIGMLKLQTRRLFVPFVQADETMTRRFGGTGLGLSISKRLAELLGGDIVVRSEPGTGSTFTVSIGAEEAGDVEHAGCTPPLPASLPGADEAALASAKAAGTAERVLRCRILLAEDGPDNRRLISMILRKAGAEVVLANDGRAAVATALAASAESHSFDLILMDMQMPELDGYGATRELRAAGWSGPIIALTAHAMDLHREQCLAAGCTDYASKPVDRTGLVEMVRRHTHGQT